MLIQPPDPITHQIDDYDFNFTNGAMLPVSLNRTAGDTIDFDSHPTAIRIMLVRKPSLADASVILPAEDITVFLSHLLMINHRIRTVTELTTAEQREWKESIQRIGQKVETIN